MSELYFMAFGAIITGVALFAIAERIRLGKGIIALTGMPGIIRNLGSGPSKTR